MLWEPQMQGGGESPLYNGVNTGENWDEYF